MNNNTVNTVDKYRVNNMKRMEYVESGRVLASGMGVLGVVFDYYENVLGYDLSDIFNDYTWVPYRSNPNYIVCELGFIANVKTGKVLEMSLKGQYVRGNKDNWRLRVTIPGVGTLKVAQVVAETFIGVKPLDDLIVGHANDVTIDNRVDNLGYITKSQNTRMAVTLRDVVVNGLNTEMVYIAFGLIQDVIDDIYGIDAHFVDELTREEAEEVADYIDLAPSTIIAIHKLVTKKSGVLARLQVVNGYYYI